MISHHTRKEAGFTLIEIIGVLAVLAVIAGIALLSTPRAIDVAAENQESTNLVKFANSFLSKVSRTHYIPGTNDIVASIADDLGMDQKDIQQNVRGIQRSFLFDPTIFISTNVPPATNWPSYQQGINGAFWLPNANLPWSNAPPNHVRLMILSSLSVNLPAGVSANVSGTNLLSASDFINLWNTPDATFPSTVSAFNGWKGTGESLKLQRIDLTGLFAHLILYNYNFKYSISGSAGIPGWYAIDRLQTNVVPAALTFPNFTNGVDAYYIKGTTLGLFSSSAGGTSTAGSLQVEQVLNRDTSFDYVQDVWRSSINLGEGIDPRASLMGNALWSTAALFLGSPYTTLSLATTNGSGGMQVGGVTPPTIVNDMTTFMQNYVTWANASFPPGALSNATYYADLHMIYDLNRLCGSSPPNGGNAPTISFFAGSCTNPPPQ
ncbi:MAG: hypothetical protein C5B50_02510 [Verrucomicrobia bacterium]|nr:MAG: hypothetical protein C5B50_02510 [Verrucomicrobiota bacterium]